MTDYYIKLRCAFGRKHRTSGMNRITRFQSVAFLEVLWGNMVLSGENIQPLDLRVAILWWKQEHFTRKARTIAPFWDLQASDLHANSEREFRGEVAGRAGNPVSPFLPWLHAWEAWHSVWTKNNTKSPYSLRESFLVKFQDPSSFLTYSICFATRRPQPQQQKQSRLPCHLSVRSPSSTEACHLAY